MKQKVISRPVAAGVLIVFSLAVLALTASVGEEMPFGGAKDVGFANKLWTAMKGYQQWPITSDHYAGATPHGKVVRLYYNIVSVEGKPYHVIAKDNFGGAGATIDSVSANPGKYLAAVTVMLQREKSYDPQNDGWFWAKYKADGTVDVNPKGMALAGRVAKGMPTGCIACHAKAKDNDYFFSNDKKE